MHGVFGKEVTKKSFHAPDTLKKSMERANSMYEHKIQEKDNKYIESLKDEMLGGDGDKGSFAVLGVFSWNGSFCIL